MRAGGGGTDRELSKTLFFFFTPSLKLAPSSILLQSQTQVLRPEKNPLDLNNLPDDYTRDGKLVFEEGSFSGSRKKKSGGKDGKDECGKGSVRSCYDDGVLPMKRGHVMKTKFVSQRETETLNRARQLVFNNDNLATQGHLGCDPTLPFRSVYPPRMFPGSSSTLMPPPQPYLQPYPTHSINDYYVGHVLGSSGSSQYPQQNLNYLGPQDSNYTCIGAPVGHGFGPSPSRGGADASLSNQEEGLNWGRSYAGGTQQRLDNPSAINRFQDGF
ncbi:hypothetical protein V6N11_082881 [Hibiscus sabdariffa]|uniref:Uncharacterized protein n=1 Tax=Hibiscus sabdariffa TaxID=183260 RepID=A0ABR2QKQ0_9ROSI